MAFISCISAVLTLGLLANADQSNSFQFPPASSVVAANQVFQLGSQVQFLWTTTWPRTNLVLFQLNGSYEILQSTSSKMIANHSSRELTCTK